MFMYFSRIFAHILALAPGGALPLQTGACRTPACSEQRKAMESTRAKRGKHKRAKGGEHSRDAHMRGGAGSFSHLPAHPYAPHPP